MSSVVNVKVKYIRPEYENLKEWCEDPNNVYIGRKGIVFIKDKVSNKKERYPKQNSPFANPFKVGKDGKREEVLEKYELYLQDQIKNNIITKEMLLTLKDKNLGCWCKPEPCHGDILIKYIF